VPQAADATSGDVEATPAVAMTRGFPGPCSGDVALIEPVTNPVQVPGKPFVHKADRMVGAIDKELSGTSAIHPEQR
jgi:hypothetical protein